MNKRPHVLIASRLIGLAKELRSRIKDCATPEVVWHCHDIFRQRPVDASHEHGLQSSYKQCWYLLGLLLGTSEPKTPRRLTSDEWDRIHELLQEVIDRYSSMFLISAEEALTLSDQERDRYAVAAPEFLRYFNNGVLASAEQMVARADAYFTPFDSELQQLLGFSGTDAIRMVGWIAEKSQQLWDDLYASADAIRELYHRSIKEKWDSERTSKELAGFRESQAPLFSKPSDPLIIKRTELEREFGSDRADAFWRYLVSERGDYSGFTYFTEENPAELRPLIGIDEGQAMCPLINSLMVAIVRRLGDSLCEEEKLRDRFYKRRDSVLETETGRVFRSFFGEHAEIFASACETPRRQYEHDLIILWNRKMLVVEAKAAPPVEPFRDVDRAFIRIRDAFRRNSGIQKGYEQANRVIRAIRSGKTVDLYDSRGVLIRTIAPSEVENVRAVCVTADDFGVLATDLSLLLQKDPTDDFPWAVNLFDLEALLEAFRLKDWGPDRLWDYLDGRARLHGHARPSDELEIAGMYIRHGRLPQPSDDVGLLIDPEYAHIFDEIYMMRHGGPKPDLRTRPRIAALSPNQVLRSHKELGQQPKQSTLKPGRNSRCPCGSGKKHKQCCGRA